MIGTMLTVATLLALTCYVTRVHDGDGLLLCRSGGSRRRPDARRTNYRCDDRAAARSQRIVSSLVLGKRLSCQPVGKSYNRVVARCTLPDGRSLSCAAIAAGAAVRCDVLPVFRPLIS